VPIEHTSGPDVQTHTPALDHGMSHSLWLGSGRRVDSVTHANSDDRKSDSMSPRILHVSQPVDGGVASVVGQLAREQVNLGVETVLASPTGPITGMVHPQTQLMHWSAQRTPGPVTVLETLKLRRIIRTVEPDIIHLHSSKAGMAGRLAIHGTIPTIFQPHAWSFVAVTGAARTLAVRWEQVATRWTDLTICVSQDERQDAMRQEIDPERLTVLPNGVDQTTFSPGDRTTARRDLGLPPTGPLVVCVARQTPEKGVDQLLDAWPGVVARAFGAHLVLVGDGPDHRALVERAAGLPNVRLVGHQDDIPRWYRSADLAVLPSRREAMALAPLEALACGCPVVGFDVEGFAQSIGSVTHPSPVVPRANASALAEAIAIRLNDSSLLALERDRGLAHVRGRHDVRQIAVEMLALYDQALTRRPGRDPARLNRVRTRP
jgi:glycosyltransferase involved in cell wall biosynthesis